MPTCEGETPPPEVASRDNHCKHKVQRSGCKVQRSGPAQNGMQQQHATPATATTDQLRISTSADGVHDAAIIATCVRAHNSNSFHALPLLWWLELHVAAASRSVLVLTFAPCTLIFALCACGGCHGKQLLVVVFLPQMLAQRLCLYPWWFHLLQLEPMVFSFHPLVQIPALHLGNLHCGGI